MKYLFLILALCGRLHAAVALSVAGVGGRATSGTALMIPFTTGSGSNRVLVFGGTITVGGGGFTNFTSVQFAGNSLTLARREQFAALGSFGIDGEVWYLVNPPASTTGNLTATAASLQFCAGGVVEYSGGDPFVPFKTSNASTSNTSPISTSLTTQTSGSWVVVHLCAFPDTNMTLDSLYTQRWNEPGSGGNNNGDSLGDRTTSAGVGPYSATSTASIGTGGLIQQLLELQPLQPTATPTITTTFTSTITPSATPTSTITPSITPTWTFTRTITATSTITPSATPTSTITPSITPTWTFTRTITATSTITPSATPTSTITRTFTDTSTSTSTVTTSATPTATPTMTAALVKELIPDGAVNSYSPWNKTVNTRRIAQEFIANAGGQPAYFGIYVKDRIDGGIRYNVSWSIQTDAGGVPSGTPIAALTPIFTPHAMTEIPTVVSGQTPRPYLFKRNPGVAVTPIVSGHHYWFVGEADQWSADVLSYNNVLMNVSNPLSTTPKTLYGNALGQYAEVGKRLAYQIWLNPVFTGTITPTWSISPTRTITVTPTVTQTFTAVSTPLACPAGAGLVNGDFELHSPPSILPWTAPSNPPSYQISSFNGTSNELIIGKGGSSAGGGTIVRQDLVGIVSGFYKVTFKAKANAATISTGTTARLGLFNYGSSTNVDLPITTSYQTFTYFIHITTGTVGFQPELLTCAFCDPKTSRAYFDDITFCYYGAAAPTATITPSITPTPSVTMTVTPTPDPT